MYFPQILAHFYQTCTYLCPPRGNKNIIITIRTIFENDVDDDDVIITKLIL